MMLPFFSEYCSLFPQHKQHELVAPLLLPPAAGFWITHAGMPKNTRYFLSYVVGALTTLLVSRVQSMVVCLLGMAGETHVINNMLHSFVLSNMEAKYR